MEQSPSETSSEAEYLARLEENLNWHAAILAVLLEEAGGAVEVSGEDLAAIPLSQAKASISYDSERDVYTIERLVPEDES